MLAFPPAVYAARSWSLASALSHTMTAALGGCCPSQSYDISVAVDSRMSVRLEAMSSTLPFGGWNLGISRLLK